MKLFLFCLVALLAILFPVTFFFTLFACGLVALLVLIVCVSDANRYHGK